MTRLCSLVKVPLYFLGLGSEKGELKDIYMFTVSSLLSIKCHLNLMFLLHAASLCLSAHILPYSSAAIRIEDKGEDALLL